MNAAITAVNAANNAIQASSNTFQGSGEPSLIALLFVLGIVAAVSIVGYAILKP